jgi:transposase
MKQKVYLQEIIGVDKKNPNFTLCRNETDPGKLYVFFGAVLLEIVPDDKKEPEFKLMIARLYNSGIKAKELTKVFGIAYTTMKRWGDALKSGDPELLVNALSGQGPPKKLTPEIRGYINVRFPTIYRETHYDYSAKIRKEIKEVFNIDISSETLRPIFKELKEQLKEKGTDLNLDNHKVADKCDLADPAKADDSHQGCRSNPEDNKESVSEDNRKDTITFYHSGAMVFCHHAGVLLLSPMITKFLEYLKDNTLIVRQWLVTVLLGAVNIEQTKLLDFACIAAMLGAVIRSHFLQRSRLHKMATQENVKHLLKCNAKMIEATQCRDFYYDPHTKHYTGIKKILKGWVASIKRVEKGLHMDFIHTVKGEPVFLEHADNFYDLRERLPKTIKEFRRKIGICAEKDLTFVFDRGLYGYEVFQGLIDSKKNHFVTWQKGYKKVGLEKEKISGKLSITRARNNATDLLIYKFSYIDRTWEKNKEIRQIIVHATNAKNKTIEVSILSDDTRRPAEEIIKLMFNRWIQENDFKYLDKHFGINQITGYAATHYKNLEKIIEDKQIKSGAFKACQKERATIKSALAAMLLKAHTCKRKNKRRQQKIEVLIEQLQQIEKKIISADKEVSRLQSVIEEKYYRLDTMSKLIMDYIKIITRNMFYQALQPFKELYNNYRDDHVIFRNLTRSHGCILFGKNEVEVLLYPTAHYQPKVHKIMELYLQQINESNPVLPDGSGRTIFFKLAKKSNKLFAIPMLQKQPIY